MRGQYLLMYDYSRMSRLPRIVVLNGTCLDVAERCRAAIEARGVELVAKDIFRDLSAGDVDAALCGADALVLPPSNPRACNEVALRHHRSIKTLAIAASGFEWLDIEVASMLGVVVTNAPIRQLSHAVADLAIGLMLAVTRQIPLHDRRIRRGDGQRAMATSIRGKTLGIIGLGRIGKQLARTAAAFDMKLIATARRPDEAFVSELGVQIVPLNELLHRSDVVSLHLRLNDHTKSIIGKPQLQLMKPSAYLVNTARRDLVDESALVEALAAGQIAGAGLDDPPAQQDSPMLAFDNVVCTTHLGCRTTQCAEALLEAAVSNALTVLAGRQPPHVVNPWVYDSPGLRAPLLSGS